MAASTRCLVLSAACAVAAAAYPPGFPCSLPPVVLESKLAPPSGTVSWPGACLGLAPATTTSETSTVALCKAKCIAKQDCTVWQLTSENVCYLSDKYDDASKCWGRDDEVFVANGAERLQHGTINITSTLATNAWYTGLKEVGTFKTTDVDLGKHRCKNQCYSDIYCDKWLYVTGTATTGLTPVALGCWKSSKDFVAGTADTIPGGQATVGENVQHTCSAPVPQAEKKKSNLRWVMIWTIVVVFLIILGLVLAIMFCRRKPKKKEATRAIKVAPKEQQVLQPLVVVQQPTVIAAPPVTTYAAAPVASYASTTGLNYQVVPQSAQRAMAS